MKKLQAEDQKRECGAGGVRVTALILEKASKGDAPKNGEDGDLRIMQHFVTAFIDGAEE